MTPPTAPPPRNTRQRGPEAIKTFDVWDPGASSIPSPHARTLIHPTTGRFMSATGHPDMIISGQLPCPLLGSCKREQRQDPSTTPQPEHPSQPVAKLFLPKTMQR